MLHDMDKKKAYRFGSLLLKIGSIAIGLIFALIKTFRDIFGSIDIEQNDDRQLHDSDLSGELNHRTGRLDSGTDPYGWYDRD